MTNCSVVFFCSTVQSYIYFSHVLCFFFKQKTAYEMRISDWSSDVCSSDLVAVPAGLGQQALARVDQHDRQLGGGRAGGHVAGVLLVAGAVGDDELAPGTERRRVGKGCVSTCRSWW